MNHMKSHSQDPNVEENVLFGVIGAFLFSLVGGLMYVVLSMVGYIAALSGLVGVVCAIKGYAFFAKKESKRGVILSVVIAAVVLILAWYVGFCIEMVDAYAYWYELGEVDYVPTIFEYLPYGIIDLTVNLTCLIDLALSLGLGALGCWRYIGNMIRQQKAQEAMAGAPEMPMDESFTADPAEEKTEE